MLRQTLQQKLQQKLSPQQIQEIKLLQIPTYALDARIKEELEINPALEDVTLADSDYTEDNYEEDTLIDEETVSDNKDDLSDYLFDDEEEYSYNAQYANEDERKEIPIVASNSFYDYLLEQLGLYELSEKEIEIASYIIGSIDDDGYLRRSNEELSDDLAFNRNIIATKEEISVIVSFLQTLDPAGIAARDLQECILIQLKRNNSLSPSIRQVSITILEKYFDDFSNKRFDKLEKQIGVTQDVLRQALKEILRLNPKPGSSLGNNSKSISIIPDFVVSNDNQTLVLSLNSKNAPELRVSISYREMLEEYRVTSQKDKRASEALQFIKQKIDSAIWFIDTIKQRQNTLLATMNAIMRFQYLFFISGEEKDLKPMILKDISEQVGLDISTISRVVNSKYVQTDNGIYSLKFFFSESYENSLGEEISTKEIKKELRNIIDNEDKQSPITDDELTEILKHKGYPLARRTVAKYREQLSIPTARLRKEL